jgi:hypothetical protein
MRVLLDHPLIAALLALGLPPADFVVAGSGPMLADGLIDDPSDLDVVARGAAWEKAINLGEVEPAPFGPVHRVVLLDGGIEILDGWFPDLWSVDELIDGATVVDGIRFADMDVVRRSKEILDRPRDHQHLELLGDR